MTSREQQLADLKAIGFDELREMLGEAIHTSLRKGCDDPQAVIAHRAISAMDRDQWAAALDFCVWGLSVQTGRKEK